MTAAESTQLPKIWAVKSFKGRDLVHPARFERATFAFGGQRSIQLSYGCQAPAESIGAMLAGP